jgi:hypothetical protein
MDGVCVVFVAVACDGSTVTVIVSAVPVVSVASAVGELVRSVPDGVGVPSPTGAQAAASRMKAIAPNSTIREILFIYFLLSLAGIAVLPGELISLQMDIVTNSLRHIKPNLDFQVWVLWSLNIESFVRQPAESSCQG